jgi:hypothetical protein
MSRLRFANKRKMTTLSENDSTCDGFVIVENGST